MIHEPKLVDDLRQFRCRHGFQAFQCSICSPRRPLGTRLVELENGKVVRCRKGMYRKKSDNCTDAIHLPSEMHFGVFEKRYWRNQRTVEIVKIARGESRKRILKILDYEES